MSNLSLANKIRNDKLTDQELIECLEIKNVVVLQQTILKLINKQIKSEYICNKLLEFSSMLQAEFKILGTCKLGHLSIYALKKLGYDEEFQKVYNGLTEIDKEPITMLENSL